MSHNETPLSDEELDTTCDLGDCLAMFTVWNIDGDIQAHLEGVKALDDDGEYIEVQGEELYRWKAQLNTQDNKDLVLEKFYN